MNEPIGVKAKIVLFEEISSKQVETQKPQKKSIVEGHSYLGKVINPQVEKEKEFAKPVIKESNQPVKAPSLEERSLVKEDRLSTHLDVEAKKIQDAPEVENLSKHVVKNEERKITVLEKTVDVDNKSAEPAKVKANPHKQLELDITKFEGLSEVLARDKSKKLGLNPGGEVVVQNRGHLKSRAGGGKDTVTIWTTHIPALAEEVLSSGEPKLMEKYAKALTSFKDSAWGQSISKNKPTLAKSMDETIGALEAKRSKILDIKGHIMTKCLQHADIQLLNIGRIGIDLDDPKLIGQSLVIFSREELFAFKARFDKATALPNWKEVEDAAPLQEIKAVAEELQKATVRFSTVDLAHMLLGVDVDKKMAQNAIQMAGWGCPSVNVLFTGFEEAIKELHVLKNQNVSIEEPLNNLVKAAHELLGHTPPLAGLRDDNKTFIDTVSKPLGKLAEGTSLITFAKDLEVAYMRTPSVKKKVIQQNFQQDAVGFKNQMEQVAKGALSVSDRARLLDNMTSDLRAHISALFCNTEVGEFEKQAWNKTNAAQTSPNLTQFPIFTDDLSFGIIDMVLENAKDPKMITRQLDFLADLATHLIKDNNIHALNSISGALNGNALTRLWMPPALVPLSNNFTTVMQEVKTVLSLKKNCAGMRAKVKVAQEKYEKGEIKNPPIPYSGLILTDLTFIDDGIPPAMDDKINGKRITLLHLAMGR